MDELKPEEVKDALEWWVGKDGMVDVSRDDPNGRITGWVMHPSFMGVSRLTRQIWLWDGYDEEGQLPSWKGLRGTFGERANQIGLLLTFSPPEYENAFEEDAKTA